MRRILITPTQPDGHSDIAAECSNCKITLNAPLQVAKRAVELRRKDDGKRAKTFLVWIAAVGRNFPAELISNAFVRSPYLQK